MAKKSEISTRTNIYKRGAHVSVPLLYDVRFQRKRSSDTMKFLSSEVRAEKWRSQMNLT